MNDHQSTPAEKAATSNVASPVYEAPGLFLERGPRGAAVLALAALAFIIFVVWTTVPFDQRSFEQFLEILLGLAQYTSFAGWNVLALAVALVAVAITTVTIVGLWRSEDSASDRHWLIMRSAEIFMLAAIGFLVGLVAAAALSLAAVAWQLPIDEENFEPIGLVVVGSAAAVLWVSVTALHGYLRRVVLSDSDRRQEDLSLIIKQRENVEELRDKARRTVKRLQGSENLTPRRTLRNSVFRSVVWIIIAAALASLLVLIPDIKFVEIPEKILAMGRVFLGVMLLAGVQMLFSVAPYVWSSQLWQTEEPGRQKAFKLIGVFLLSSPVTVLVFTLGAIGIFSPEVTAPFWKQMLLAVFIILPSFVSLFFPKRWSWRAVSANSAFEQNSTRLGQLKAREQYLNAASTAAEEQTGRGHANKNLDSRSQQIISLLEKLVENEGVPEEPDHQTDEFRKAQPKRGLSAILSFRCIRRNM